MQLYFVPVYFVSWLYLLVSVPVKDPLVDLILGRKRRSFLTTTVFRCVFLYCALLSPLQDRLSKRFIANLRQTIMQVCTECLHWLRLSGLLLFGAALLPPWQQNSGHVSVHGISLVTNKAVLSSLFTVQ